MWVTIGAAAVCMAIVVLLYKPAGALTHAGRTRLGTLSSSSGGAGGGGGGGGGGSW